MDDLSEPMLTKFEQLADKHGMGLAYLFPFPTYSKHIYMVTNENTACFNVKLMRCVHVRAAFNYAN